MTRDWFDAQLGRMVMLKAMPGDSGEYWRLCEAIPERVIERGISLAIKTRTWFPTPAEFLQDCDTARPRDVLPAPIREVSREAFTATIHNPFGGKDLTVTVDREWKYYCSDCSDTGQRTWWCGRVEDDGRKSWVDVRHCGRRGEHGTHEFAARCACWETNPDLIRKREQAARYADANGKASR